MWKRVGICSGLLLSQVSGLTVPAANKVSSPMSSAIGRRTLLAGGAATVGAAVLASPDAAFAAANAGSDGKWAQRYDEFTDEDFKDFSTSPSGLQYKIIEEGFGVKPVSGQKIKAHYAGYLLNGAKFDSSYDRRKPLEFQVGIGRVIKGWDEALLDMKVGEKRMLRIPSNLAYGSRGAGGVIPPDAVLVFYVELVTLAA